MGKVRNLKKKNSATGLDKIWLWLAAFTARIGSQEIYPTSLLLSLAFLLVIVYHLWYFCMYCPGVFFVEFRKVYHLITPLKCVSPGPDHLCLFVWYFLSRYHICNICICICAIYCYFVNLIFRIQPQFTHYLFLTIVIFVFEFEIFLVTVFLAEKTDYHFESSCFWWFKIYN